jgi:hypothetical protein
VTTHEIAPQTLEDPHALLERQLIGAYLAGAGHTTQELLSRTDEDARMLLAEASRYASERLSEIDARWHYLHSLRGEV